MLDDRNQRSLIKTGPFWICTACVAVVLIGCAFLPIGRDVRPAFLATASPLTFWAGFAVTTALVSMVCGLLLCGGYEIVRGVVSSDAPPRVRTAARDSLGIAGLLLLFLAIFWLLGKRSAWAQYTLLTVLLLLLVLMLWAIVILIRGPRRR
jgi:hypothetical protein